MRDTLLQKYLSMYRVYVIYYIFVSVFVDRAQGRGPRGVAYSHQRLSTYLGSANAVVTELLAVVSANESLHPLHSISFSVNYLLYT
jgi:hypothetical protein